MAETQRDLNKRVGLDEIEFAGIEVHARNAVCAGTNTPLARVSAMASLKELARRKENWQDSNYSLKEVLEEGDGSATTPRLQLPTRPTRLMTFRFRNKVPATADGLNRPGR